jgi:hypothetical protein
MSDQPIIHHAAEALKPQSEIAYIVKGVFCEGSLSVVFGEPGSKKTYSMFDACVCVALGKNWLNFPTTKAPVLIVDEESGKQRMNKRLGAVMRAHGAGEDLQLSYVVLEGFDLQTITDRKKLHAIILRTEAKFVILDALADFLPGDENSVKDVLPGLRALRYIANDTKAAIVLIHHAGKSGKYRGSSSIKGAVDLMLEVQSRPGSPNIDFSCEKARDVEPFEFAAVIIFEDGIVYLTPSGNKSGGDDLNSVEKYVLNYLEENGDSFITEIGKSAESKGICKSETARKSVYKLVDLKMVERKNKGAAGSKAIYGLITNDLFDLLDQADDIG